MHRTRTLQRRGFTLFEVAIALAISTAVIAAALAIFPSGIKVQQLARFRLLASAKAYELIQRFNTASNNNNSIDLEARDAWDVPSSYVNLANDFEAKMSTRGFGIRPMPTRIARRLDSAGDEIQRLLDGGGQIYYCAVSSAVEQDAQKLVFAVDGYAQQNAIAQFHRKRWPYYVAYPSPPQVMHHRHDWFPGMSAIGLPADWSTGDTPGVGFGMRTTGGNWGRIYLWDAYAHPDDPTWFSDVQKAFYYRDPDTGIEYGAQRYTEWPAPITAATMLPLAERSFQGALWLAVRSGMSSAALENIAAPLTDFSQGTCEPWRQVMAMRYLSFAATCLTRWKDDAELSGGYDIPSVALKDSSNAAVSTPQVTITRDRIVAWHESAINLIDVLAASDPYDWGAPRPAERPTMMDMPLMQWDLFTPPATGVITGTSVTAAQWKPLSAQPITHVGVSYSYPESAPPAGAFSSAADHFNLTAAFTAAERCRQLVFWSVDWQAYEDFETAPSAAVDASRWPKAAPWPSAGAEMWSSGLDWIAPHQANFGNPEKPILFCRSMHGGDGIAGTADDVATGTDLIEGSGGNDILGSEIFYAPDKDPRIFCGIYGADRNGNLKLDRGQLGVGVRLFAQTIARVNFYDPRLCMVLR